MQPKFKLIIAFVIILCVCSVLLLFYPLQFDLYEQAKAKKMVDLVVVPIFAFFLIRYVVRKIKQGGVDRRIFPKEILLAIFIFAALHFLIIRSVASCGLLFVNCSFPPDTQEMNGVVTEVVNADKVGKMLPIYTLSVNENAEEFVFESNKKTVGTFSVNDSVKIEMKKGILGLLYK
ncbi:hypothetical protein HUK80_13745 [Flavobacterium sp. MAH-1]|uniref:Uncharacterized protein n=1 Tax=Flavobacterium agri TaxID=2743471 RepID=A0A7Y9C640_9FLAO|nr:hypothetical protein [Flavobacterium agri]NUY81962.1 hypothetical protein [Flavobacterium agri]NYA71986.1 hypothetical protein [Flavobacterium agri]